MARPPLGVAHVDRLDGGVGAKRRLRTILSTVSGELDVARACQRIGVRETQFADLRRRALQAALESLEPGIPGRPRKQELVSREEHDALRRERDRLQIELYAQRVRAEIALVMPHVLEDPGGGAKKASTRARRAARRSPGQPGTQSG